MELSELTAYAFEKYRIREDHGWVDIPGFSVLLHPRTGQCVVLLMRQWDSDSGEEIQRCDLKCGRECLTRDAPPYLSPPLRMSGSQWVNIAFDSRTERDVVFGLLDKAVALNAPQGSTIVLASRLPRKKNVYRDTALPFAGRSEPPMKKEMPERLREMRRLYRYDGGTEATIAGNFYRQAVFMRDYEDDCPWKGDFIRFYPTYQDLTTRQLRGYFTWRTRLRRGDFQPIPTSVAYIYLYELINGVGADTPEDVMKKFREFETGYLDSGVGDVRMRPNLRRWMLEYAVVHDLPPELARQAADPDMLARDEALTVLRKPASFDDEAVFAALCAFGGRKTADSPVVTRDPARGRHLFSEVWRTVSASRGQGTTFFTAFFGRKKTRRWYPFANAVYYEPSTPEDRKYILNECRSYRCRGGDWQVTAYEKLSFDRAGWQGFLHETDARLRRYLETGRYLKEKPADEWAVPFIDAVIEADRKAVREAARPKITIDLSGLEQIRRDAAATRDSLLTGEEREDAERTASVEDTAVPAAAPSERIPPALPFDTAERRILRALLRGEDAAGIVRECHLMPSVAADTINEMLVDEIGDSVILCEDDRLSLVEDYREELEEYLGGTQHD